MDLSKFKTSDKLKVGGAIAFFVFGFLNWVSVDAGAFSNSGGNVFDFFWTGIVPWLLIIATGVLTVLSINGTLKSNLPWPLIFLAATGMAALLMILRLVFNPIAGSDAIEALGGSVGRGVGMILSALASLVALAGSVIGFTESGGDLNDLKDVNKIKAAFNQGDGTPPPPAPSGDTPPPPPPMPS